MCWVDWFNLIGVLFGGKRSFKLVIFNLVYICLFIVCIGYWFRFGLFILRYVLEVYVIFVGFSEEDNVLLSSYYRSKMKWVFWKGLF